MASHVQGMETIPGELLWQICHHVDHKGLQNLRLVCRKFKPYADEFLFETFILWEHRDSWSNLQSITQTPHLAPLVKIIKVATLERLRDLDYDSWAGLVPRKDLPKTEPEQALAYIRYCDWYHNEKYMRDERLRTMLFPKFSLVNLRCDLLIEPVDLRQILLFTYDTRDWRNQRSLPMRATLIRCYEGGYISNSHLESFLYALMQGAGDPRSIEVAFRQDDDYAPCWPSLRLNYLKQFHLDEIIYTKAFTVPRMHDAVLLSPWFKQMPNLENLSLTQCPFHRFNGLPPTSPALDVLGILCKAVDWPKLKSVSLHHILTTAETLWKFLYRHRKSLVSLKIVEPVLRPNDWTSLRDQIRPGSTIFQHLLHSECELTEVYVDKEYPGGNLEKMERWHDHRDKEYGPLLKHSIELET